VATVVAVVSVTGKIPQRALSFPSGYVATARHRMWPDVMSVANAKYGGGGFPAASAAVIGSVAPVPAPPVKATPTPAPAPGPAPGTGTTPGTTPGTVPGSPGGKPKGRQKGTSKG